MDWETIVIPSDPNFMGVVERRALALVEEHGFGEERVFALRLAIEEAIANAIKHGNRFDPEKHVYVDATITPGKLDVTIRDEGEGYCPDCIADPTAPCNLEHPGGRGLLLIRAYMDEVTHSNEGRAVRMVKQVSK